MPMKQTKPLASLGAVIAGAVVSASAFAGDVTFERLNSSEKEPQN